MHYYQSGPVHYFVTFCIVSETFPATLYTQGPESDSDLDDHVPLRNVVKRKHVIDSDDDD